jgi:PhoPQ-activated pathogenicity-related protein
LAIWLYDFRAEFEEGFDEKIKTCKADQLREYITPYELTKCKTNCLEKSLQVCRKKRN